MTTSSPRINTNPESAPASSLDLHGRVALVTGGNRGIGLGIALGLARAGADVAVWGLSAERNAAAVELLEPLGVRVVAQRCDVADEAAVEAGFAATLETFGHVDAVFANAGIAPAQVPFAEQTLADWRRIMSVNLEGVFLTLRAASRHMIARGGGGSLVAISSLGAVMGQPGRESYSASKAGVTAMMRGLSVELARYAIRANALLPGFIRTDMTPELDSPRAVEHVLRRVPVRRWGDPEDFAGIATYLAGDASRYHTGQEFIVDGGYVNY